MKVYLSGSKTKNKMKSIIYLNRQSFLSVIELQLHYFKEFLVFSTPPLILKSTFFFKKTEKQPEWQNLFKTIILLLISS